MEWARKAGINGHTLGDIVTHPEVRKRVQQAVDAVNAGQPGYATIKKFAILPHEFSQANGELTPTLKLRRKHCAQKYKAIVDSFYD